MAGHTGANSGMVTPTMLISEAMITVEHGALEDAAFRSLSIASTTRGVSVDGDEGSLTVRVDNFISAGTAPTDAKKHEIAVNFNGRDAISSWDAGSASVSFTDRSGTDDLSLPHSVSGPLAAISRGGLSTEINMAQSSYGDGATRYQSWVRVANNGANDGSVTITLYDAATGDFIGAWDSGMIPAGGSIQVPVSDLEDEAGYSPGPGQQYNISIDGGINGYAQHVMWNTVEGLFSDLSGFRAGGGAEHYAVITLQLQPLFGPAFLAGPLFWCVDTAQTSRSKANRLHRTPTGFITPTLDGCGLRDHLLARPTG